MRPPAARTVGALLDALAASHGALPALLDEHGTAWGFAELRARARERARDLLALGLAPGERLAILMGNRAEWVLLDLAAKLIGAIPVGINTWSTTRELEYVLDHSGAAILVTADRFLKADFLTMLDALRPWPERLPALRRVVVIGADARDDMLPFTAFAGMGAAVADAALDRLAGAVRPEDPAILLYTSGSTSKPKGVLLGHAGLIANMWDIGARLHLEPGDRVWLAVSLFWALGSVNALFAAFTHGAAIVLQDHFEAGAALGLIRDTGCTALYGTPNMLAALLAHPARLPDDLALVRKCATIGTPEQMHRAIREI
ncbi:MAG: AMP-binding protein, partial [Rhodospirillales bacterium]|nr:AMP-binding protein [Rhodospirillales bacterium]